MTILARSIRKNFLMGACTVKPAEIQAFSTGEKVKIKNLSDIYVGASESFEKTVWKRRNCSCAGNGAGTVSALAGNEEKDADEL